MNLLNTILGIPLGYLMYICYLLVKDYGLAIIFFTLLSKVILFPISILVQKNSIKMIKIQPDLLDIKKRYAGNKDMIAEEQIKVYDREKYSPAMGCLPMFLQIPLILGLINVIYNPLQHLLHLDSNTITTLINDTKEVLGTTSLGSSSQLKIVDTINQMLASGNFSSFSNVNPSILTQIQELKTEFLGLSLSSIPSITAVSPLWIIPVLAGLSAFALSAVQDKANVLQREQSRINQIAMMLFIVAFSVYFTFIVPAGVGLYWIFSNLFSILQLLVLNKIYDPKKYIDYSKRIKKVTLTEEEKKAQKAKAKEYRIRTKLDKKRFYEALNKQLVFYSEKSGFYKYYQTVIEYILSHSEVCIHYITSDPEDAVFSMKEPRIIPYYISDNTLMPVMMKMDADMVVMTMPDIQQYHIKRSMVRKDIEYVYMFHYPLSTHMVLRKGALDHYDTIFCIGEFQVTEIRETEKVYGLKEKKLVLNGYGLLEKLYEGYINTPFENRLQKKVLIAPSWQPDNILDSCIDKILDSILAKGYQIVVRPHPEYVKRFGDNMDAIVSRYESYKGGDLHFELDFSKSSSLFDSDIVISDWSGAAYEFAFVTKRPVIFINTPPKINNPEYQRISVQPLEISLRDRIGLQLEVNELGQLNEKIEELFQSSERYNEKISTIFSEIIYEFGHSGEIGGKYILDALEEAGKRRESGDFS